MKAKHHPKPDLEKIAAILVDLELSTVRHVCQVHGITRTTLYRYRSRLKTDAELGRLVTASLKACRPPAPTPTAKAVVDAAYQWLRDNIPMARGRAGTRRRGDGLTATLEQQTAITSSSDEFFHVLNEPALVLGGALVMLRKTGLARPAASFIPGCLWPGSTAFSDGQAIEYLEGTALVPWRELSHAQVLEAAIRSSTWASKWRDPAEERVLVALDAIGISVVTQMTLASRP